MRDPDSENLIHRAKEGSQDALDRLFGRYGERLLALVRLRLGPGLRPQIESQDVLQETLLNAFRRIDQFEGSGERTLMAWLGAIARNVIRDQVDYHHRERRDAKRQVPLGEIGEVVESRIRDEVSRVALHEKSVLLERAIEELDPDRREVILLRSFEELTFPEIAERTGRTADACRMMYRRTRTSLAIRMRELAREASGRSAAPEPR